MECPSCQSSARQSSARPERPERTERGYPRCHGRAGAGGLTERTGTGFNRRQDPTEGISLVIPWRVRYTPSVPAVAELFLERGLILTPEAGRSRL